MVNLLHSQTLTLLSFLDVLPFNTQVLVITFTFGHSEALVAFLDLSPLLLSNSCLSWFFSLFVLLLLAENYNKWLNLKSKLM